MMPQEDATLQRHLEKHAEAIAALEKEIATDRRTAAFLEEEFESRLIFPRACIKMQPAKATVSPALHNVLAPPELQSLSYQYMRIAKRHIMSAQGLQEGKETSCPNITSFQKDNTRDSKFQFPDLGLCRIERWFFQVAFNASCTGRSSYALTT